MPPPSGDGAWIPTLRCSPLSAQDTGGAGSSQGVTESQHRRGTGKLIGCVLNFGAMDEKAFTKPKREVEWNFWFRDIVRLMHAEGVHVILAQDCVLCRIYLPFSTC